MWNSAWYSKIASKMTLIVSLLPFEYIVYLLSMISILELVLYNMAAKYALFYLVVLSVVLLPTTNSNSLRGII